MSSDRGVSLFGQATCPSRRKASTGAALFSGKYAHAPKKKEARGPPAPRRTGEKGRDTRATQLQGREQTVVAGLTAEAGAWWQCKVDDTVDRVENCIGRRMDHARPPPPPEDLLDVSGDSSRLSSPAGDSYGSPSRPLQLPRVGWDDDDGAGQSIGMDHENQPENSTSEIPPASSCDDSLTHRSMSRSAEGDLMSIPEDVSVHGAWPDYYPDLLSSCYDYDANQKAYRYRRCSPQTLRNVFAILVIVIGAIVGANMRNSRRRHHNSAPSSSWIETDDSYLEGSQDDEDGDVDLYQAIMDSFHPIMFDDSSEWDGTFFNAYEFCGRQFSRVPCPYMAVSVNADEATSFCIKLLTVSLSTARWDRATHRWEASRSLPVRLGRLSTAEPPVVTTIMTGWHWGRRICVSCIACCTHTAPPRRTGNSLMM